MNRPNDWHPSQYQGRVIKKGGELGPLIIYLEKPYNGCAKKEHIRMCVAIPSTASEQEATKIIEDGERDFVKGCGCEVAH